MWNSSDWLILGIATFVNSQYVGCDAYWIECYGEHASNHFSREWHCRGQGIYERVRDPTNFVVAVHKPPVVCVLPPPPPLSMSYSYRTLPTWKYLRDIQDKWGRCGSWEVTEPKIPRFACIVPVDIANAHVLHGRPRVAIIRLCSVPTDLCQGHISRWNPVVEAICCEDIMYVGSLVPTLFLGYYVSSYYPPYRWARYLRSNVL